MKRTPTGCCGNQPQNQSVLLPQVGIEPMIFESVLLHFAIELPRSPARTRARAHAHTHTHTHTHFSYFLAMCGIGRHELAWLWRNSSEAQAHAVTRTHGNTAAVKARLFYTVNPEYIVRTQFSYPGLFLYACYLRTVADRCGFSDLLCTFRMHFIFVRNRVRNIRK